MVQQGGATIVCTAVPRVSFTVDDLQDGTYAIEWEAAYGECQVKIKVNGVPCIGSPFTVNGGESPLRGAANGVKRLSLLAEDHIFDQTPFAMKPSRKGKGGTWSGTATPESGKSSTRAGVDGEAIYINGHFRGRRASVSTKKLTVPADPVTHTRRRMSLGLSGLDMPDDCVDPGDWAERLMRGVS